MNTPERHQPEGTKGKAAKGRIPRFRNIEEAAEFWDSHDSTEFEDEFEQVKETMRFVVRRAPATRAITVRVDEDTMVNLTKQAAERGIGPSTLVRMLILEYLKKSQRTATQ